MIFLTILWRKQICRGIGVVTSRCFPSTAILAQFLHTTLILMAKLKKNLKLLYIDILYYSLIMYNLTFSSRENLLSYINSSESIARLEYRILKEYWGCPFLEISIIFSHSHKSSAIYMMPICIEGTVSIVVHGIWTNIYRRNETFWNHILWNM